MFEYKIQIFAILFTPVDTAAYNFDSEITGKLVRYSAQLLTKSKIRRPTFNFMGEGGRSGLSFDAVVLSTRCKTCTLNVSVRNIDYRLNSLLVPTIKLPAENPTGMILSKEIPLNRPNRLGVEWQLNPYL
jgi:hypothetical protein